MVILHTCKWTLHLLLVQQHQERGEFQGLSLLVCLPLLERGEGEVERKGKFPGPFPPVVHLEFCVETQSWKEGVEEGGLFPDTVTQSLCVWFDNNMLQISQTNLCTKLLLLHGLVKLCTS